MIITLTLKNDPDIQNSDPHIILALKSFLDQWQDRTKVHIEILEAPTVIIDTFDELPVRIDREYVYYVWYELLRGFIDLYRDSNLKDDRGMNKLLSYAKIKDREIRSHLKLPEKELEV